MTIGSLDQGGVLQSGQRSTEQRRSNSSMMTLDACASPPRSLSQIGFQELTTRMAEPLFGSPHNRDHSRLVCLGAS